MGPLTITCYLAPRYCGATIDLVLLSTVPILPNSTCQVYFTNQFVYISTRILVLISILLSIDRHICAYQLHHIESQFLDTGVTHNRT